MENDRRDIETNRRVRHLFVRVFNSDKKAFIRLIGKLDNPRIIIDENRMILGYVKNGKYVFTQNDRKTIISEIKLYENMDDYHEDDINYIREICVCDYIYKIRFKDSILFLSGYNYFSSNKSPKNGYPIFSKYNPKIFYSEEYAQKSADKLNEFGYNVTVVHTADDTPLLHHQV